MVAAKRISLQTKAEKYISLRVESYFVVNKIKPYKTVFSKKYYTKERKFETRFY